MSDVYAADGPRLKPVALAESSLLRVVLSEWLRLQGEAHQGEREWSEKHGLTLTSEMIRNRDEITAAMAAEAAQFIGYFEQDNSGLSAPDLVELARKVSPGGAHDGGLLVRLILHIFPFADPTLLIAAIYANWHGGKVGFQFLPDPTEMTLAEYEDEVFNLWSVFDNAWNFEPRHILIDDDLAFYEALPERFSVYRGCSGISADKAGAGLCWTTDRAVAEWFAHRNAGPEKAPILLTARAHKRDVLLTNASESEVVLQARKVRELKLGSPKTAPWDGKKAFSGVEA